MTQKAGLRSAVVATAKRLGGPAATLGAIAVRFPK
jgi:hypothetical protein